MGARHFRDLVCWQLANQLKCEVFAFTDKPPVCHDRDFCTDLRRASRSAPNNMAEGFGRYTHREFAYFLSNASGSLTETQNHLVDAHQSGYLSQSEFERLNVLADRALRATQKLRSVLISAPTPAGPNSRRRT